MTEDERRRRRFSEEFRKEQVVLIESGKTTVGEVAKRYQVKTQSVKVWLVRHGKKPVAQVWLFTSYRKKSGHNLELWPFFVDIASS